MTYADIEKVNAGLNGIDVKGKNYVMVPQRVKAFRQLYPEGFINTKLLSLENGVCVMQTEAGYYKDGVPVVLGTGMAYEKETSSYINKTSYIENCETSAVGRALGFLGLGIEGGGICSAEELANAISNQGSPAKPSAPATVTTAAKVPAKVTVPAITPQQYIKEELVTMGELFGIPNPDDMMKKFLEMRQGLIDGGVVPDVKSKDQTMEQARQLVEAIYANFRPSGEKK